MINKVRVRNFKSIKNLEFFTSRVNIFIGKPDSGKSNILEAIGLYSLAYDKSKVRQKNSISDYIRAENMSDMFHDKIIDNKISVEIKGDSGQNIFNIIYHDEKYELCCSELADNREIIKISLNKDFKNISKPEINYCVSLPVRFYRFKQLIKYPFKELDFLYPPYGDNLLSIINHRKDAKDFVINLLDEYGYKYQGFSDTNKIYFIIEKKNESIPIPLYLLSDTLLRVIFFNIAIELSSNASLIFEEPEAHIFPFYNKYLAEKIALYNSNQFFIATHNPTFVLNLIEKTSDEDLKIFLTYYDSKEFSTKLKSLSKEETESLSGYGESLFMNLDKYI
jgi:AAA15 family ATPase/GTPase